MQDFPDVLAEARLWQIVALSLEVSLTAVALAALPGLPLGAAIAVGRFPRTRSRSSCCSTRSWACRRWSSACWST